MSINEILSDVKVEGEDPFKDLTEETVTPSESAAEKEPSGDEPKGDEPAAPGKNTEEKTVPFHEDPRWQAMHEKASKVDILEKEIADLKTFRTEVSKDRESNPEIPSWFKLLYGENLEAWQEYSQYDSTRRSEIKEEMKRDQQKEQDDKVAQEKHWENWVESELKKLESSGKKFNRNELIQVMLDTRPTDVNGNFDFEAGYKTLEYKMKADPQKAQATQSLQARKQVADSLGKTSRGDTKPKDYMTASELRNTSWNRLGTKQE